MDLNFILVLSDDEIEQLAHMADVIWHEYWPELISTDQVDYMVEKFQSVAAITRDIRENHYEYWILEVDGKIVGYTGGHEEKSKSRYFISKIYLYQNERGKKYASQVIRFYENLCHARNLSTLYLTVHKYNELGIRAYIAKGFEVTDAVENDIGQGFIMDDFIMEKKVI